MSDVARYTLPGGTVGLTGPVARPEPGQLPLRGDLAHIALAGTHLAAHYAVPIIRNIGASGVSLRLQPRADADTTQQLMPGTIFEVLDYTGDWAWGCCGPAGPAGYVLTAELSAADPA